MITDSSLLIYLAKMNKLEILEKLYGPIYITEEIYNETVKEGLLIDALDAKIILEAKEKGMIKIISLNKEHLELSKKLRNIYKLGYGESDAIALALQEKKKEVLIDDGGGRKVCKMYNLQPKGTLGVILESYKRNILNEQEVKEIIKELIKSKFWIGGQLINEFWNIFEKIKKK